MPTNIHRQTTVDSSDSCRVLVVDDEPAILFAYRRLLEKDGMTVDISTCFEEAVRHIRERCYMAVIADLRLAGTDNGDGLEVLRVVRNERPDTITILSTGFGDSSVEKAAQDMGISCYFKKPVQPADILDALRRLNTALVSPVAAVPS